MDRREGGELNEMLYASYGTMVVVLCAGLDHLQTSLLSLCLELCTPNVLSLRTCGFGRNLRSQMLDCRFSLFKWVLCFPFLLLPYDWDVEGSEEGGERSVRG